MTTEATQPRKRVVITVRMPQEDKQLLDEAVRTYNFQHTTGSTLSLNELCRQALVDWAKAEVHEYLTRSEAT